MNPPRRRKVSLGQRTTGWSSPMCCACGRAGWVSAGTPSRRNGTPEEAQPFRGMGLGGLGFRV